MRKEKDTQPLRNGNVKRKKSERTTSTTNIKDVAYRLSDNGRCWWIETYIKNSYYNKFQHKQNRRR